MSWEPIAVIAVALIFFFGFIALAMAWVRYEAKRSAGSEVREKATADTLEAERRGNERETKFRDLDRDARLKLLLDRWHARHPKAVPGAKRPGDSGSG